MPCHVMQRDALVITEVPYQTVKAKVIEDIAKLVDSKKARGAVGGFEG